MNRESEINSPEWKALTAEFVELGERFTQALCEVASELGEQELAERAAQNSDTDIWPNPGTLEVLENRHPGAAGSIIQRVEDLAAVERAEQLRRYEDDLI